MFEEEQQNHFQQQLEADRTRERLDQMTAEFDQVSERHRVELEAALTELETIHKESVDRLVLEADQEHATLAEDLKSAYAEDLEQLESLSAEETRALEKELREVKEQLQNLQEKPQQHQHQQQQQQHQKQEKEEEQQDLSTSKTDRDSVPESSKELLAQVAAVREELAKAHKEIHELKRDRQGRKHRQQEEVYGNGNGNGHSNGSSNGNGSLETPTPNSTIFEYGQDTSKSKPAFSDAASETATATAAAMDLTQGTGRGDGDTRRDFSWTQFAFPMDKRNQTCINHVSWITGNINPLVCLDAVFFDSNHPILQIAIVPS